MRSHSDSGAALAGTGLTPACLSTEGTLLSLSVRKGDLVPKPRVWLEREGVSSRAASARAPVSESSALSPLGLGRSPGTWSSSVGAAAELPAHLGARPPVPAGTRRSPGTCPRHTPRRHPSPAPRSLSWPEPGGRKGCWDIRARPHLGQVPRVLIKQPRRCPYWWEIHALTQWLIRSFQTTRGPRTVDRSATRQERGLLC